MNLLLQPTRLCITALGHGCPNTPAMVQIWAEAHRAPWPQTLSEFVANTLQYFTGSLLLFSSKMPLPGGGTTGRIASEVGFPHRSRVQRPGPQPAQSAWPPP